MNVFAETAPKLWANQYRVVPIQPGTKKPSLEKWQGYVSSVLGRERQADWLVNFASHGIGVLLGAAVVEDMVLVAIDLDDDRLVAPARALFPNANVGKRGKKGETLFGLIPAEQKPKSSTLKGTEGLGSVDFLAGGRQTVLNPSIHPETGEAYQAVGRNLADTPPSELPIFDMQQVRLLAALVGRPETLTLMNGVGTHDAGVSLAAKLVSAGGKGDQVEAVMTALFPADYHGNSLAELSGWIASALEKGFAHDGADDDEGQNLTTKLVQMIKHSALELFHDRDKNAYIAVASGQGQAVYRLDSHAFKLRVRHQFYMEEGRSIGTGPIGEAIATVEAYAVFAGPERPVHLRVAGDMDLVEVELGRSDGATVQIAAGGWKISRTPINSFIRGAGYEALPDPEPGGKLVELQALLSLSADNFYLLISFLLNALKPTGPYFILLIEGEQGSGKSFFSQIIKMLIDPNVAMRTRMPERDSDIMIQAKEYRLLNFDNTSAVKPDISDMLCSLATGGGVAVRRLYTNGDLHVMSYSRPFVINGITGYANRPDLLERAIPIRLATLAEGERRTEDELNRDFLAMRPRLLGALYDLVASALRYRNSIEPPRNLRMADAALWIAAAEIGLALEPGTLTSKIAEAQDALVVERVNDEALIIKLRTMLSRNDGKPIEDYIGSIFGHFDPHQDRGLPRSPSTFSKQLVRYAPAMAKAGLVIEFLEKDRSGRKIWLGTTEQIGQPGTAYKARPNFG